MTVLFADTVGSSGVSGNLENVADGATPIVANGGPFSTVSNTNSFTTQASIAQASTGTKSLRVAKAGAGNTGNGVATTGSLSLGSTWIEYGVTLQYFPDTAAFTVGTNHSVIQVSNDFAIVADFSAGLTSPKVKAGIIASGGASYDAVSTTSGVLTNKAWHQIAARVRRASSTTLGIRLFVDGVEVGTEVIGTHTPPTTFNPLRVGVFTALPAADVGTITNTHLFYIDDLQVFTVEPPSLMRRFQRFLTRRHTFNPFLLGQDDE